MKNYKYFIGLLLAVITLSCSGDSDSGTEFLGEVAAPTNISALFTISNDNTGKVTIRPDGEGVSAYDIYFGDGTVEPATVAPGQDYDHIYAEGHYTVKIVAMTVNGKTTEYTQDLDVTFVAPENLQMTAIATVGNAYQLNVSASADYETYFEVTFGDDPAAVPVQFNQGQTISHTYTTVGTYTITVIAYSGGAATSQVTQDVTVFDPLLLPVNFESPTLNYAFGDFGGAVSAVVDNPDISGLNTSSRVAKLTKNPGAEVWAGVTLPLDQPIDFSSLTKISIKTYSPAPGKIVKLKLENLSNANINIEKDAVTTVANGWEILTYDFAGINNANNYQRLVIFYDFGNNGTGSTFYFDDIMQTTGAAQVVLPLTFQNLALTYTFTGFGGANTTVENNPSVTGINTSTRVAKLVKNNGSEVWAGSFINLQQPIDFSSLHKIKMKVWSPQSGIVVKLKLENFADANINTELDATTTTSNGWEELTYDFTGVNNANAYQRVVVFFAFGATGTGASYYFDDIQLSN
jgi:subtilisin-like proprotein convertase family protein